MALPTIDNSLLSCLTFLNEKENGTSLYAFQQYFIKKEFVKAKDFDLRDNKLGETTFKRILDYTFYILNISELARGDKTSFKITRRGKMMLKDNPRRVSLEYLEQEIATLQAYIDQNISNKRWFDDCKKLNEKLSADGIKNKVLKVNPIPRIEAEVLDSQIESLLKRSQSLRIKYNEEQVDTNLKYPQIDVPNTQQSLFPPQTRIDVFCKDYEQKIKVQLLKYLQKEDPVEVFEKLVLLIAFRLLYGEKYPIEKMKEVCNLTPKTGDGGKDGIITKPNEKKYYTQAKRYADKNNITEGMIRDFLGSVGKSGIIGGYFVTTSSFNDDALNAAKEADKDINLIDGKQLVEYMIQFGIGLKEVPIPSKLISGTIYEFDEDAIKKIQNLDIPILSKKNK
jgi:restriction endonuclease Mrr